MYAVALYVYNLHDKLKKNTFKQDILIRHIGSSGHKRFLRLKNSEK